MFIVFVLRLIIVLLDTPTAVELSHWMGALGCSQQILMKVFRSGTVALAKMNSLDISASAAEDITNLMIWVTVRTGPLLVGTGVSSERMMCAPARLHTLLRLRYAASECPARTIPLARKRMPSLG